MMDKLLIGRYIPADSFVHRLDPRSKLIFIFLFIAVVFLANNAVSYGVLIIFTLVLLLLTKLPLRFIAKGLTPVWWLILFTFFLHFFFNKEGEIIFSFGFITIHEEGLRQGIFISLRFLLLVVVTTLLTLTTTPIAITDGLETLFNPLKKVHFPVHEIALMMSISLRFIPTLMEETDKIMKAQISRGSDLGSKGIKGKLKAIVPLLIPLFVSAFKRAEDLAIAMEARGYRGGEGRTKYRKLQWNTKDTLAVGSLFIIAALLVIVRG
ncbi:cobalt ABC transporter permease [Bacillus coahuilensis p1.1.43]|uniref:Energy-coupling factor transporter transmembrane protein EcfT n=1 Tax=Bacillus coahuilensis p1.1.43 TaxID=1150625 RepID=A0A147K5A1_9BACI|nr:energy-coupling factor transporter transmembrane protein EcfT [Bacillus coahuilensis]KUP04759.1 cobalt ABC transporter permease [Bacillus coahuilensis p1.1.43]